MSDIETQASQRTVVAFISGLLIGGLLVWVFTSTPESATPVDENIDADVESVDVNGRENELISASANEDAVGGALSVSNQAAGADVSLDDVTYPSESGWVVVREFANGVHGNVLGAARYDADTGLTPTSVKLLRATTPGATYEVLFYTNGGESGFSLEEDVPMTDAGVRFTAN